MIVYCKPNQFSSSINIASSNYRSHQWGKDKNERLILITLGAEKVFDVVDHIHLFWKLYYEGITCSTWLLLRELYKNTSTQVKSHGRISEAFTNEQGVKQGGILSANFYKAYNKNILDTLEATYVGFKIGTNYLGSPICAEDIMLMCNIGAGCISSTTHHWKLSQKWSG